MIQTEASARVFKPLLLLISVGVVAIGVFGSVIAVMAVDGVVLWNALRFSGVMVLAGLLGVGLSIGRPKFGSAIGAVCIAGAVGAGAYLAWLELSPNLQTEPTWRSMARAWVAGSIGLAGLAMLWAGVSVLRRGGAASLKRIGLGLGLLIPLAGIMAIGWWMYGPGGVSVPDPARIAYAVFGGAASIALISAAGHHLIMAFDRVAEA